jgi:hypothetical protein
MLHEGEGFGKENLPKMQSCEAKTKGFRDLFQSKA